MALNPSPFADPGGPYDEPHEIIDGVDNPVDPDVGRVAIANKQSEYIMATQRRLVAAEEAIEGLAVGSGLQGPQGPTGPQGAPGVIQTINGKTGASITLGSADVGADAAGTAAAAQAASFPLAGGVLNGPLSFGNQTTPNEYWVSKGNKASDSNSGDKDAPFATIGAAIAAAAVAPAGHAAHIRLGYGTWQPSGTDANGNAVTMPAIQGCVLEGIAPGMTAIQIGFTATWGVAVQAGICQVKNLMIETTAGGTLTYGAGVTTPIKSSGSAEQCRFENVYVTAAGGGTITYGFSLGGDTTGGSIDIAETRLVGCVAVSTTTAGYYIGNGTAGNILNNFIDGCTSSHSTYGVYCNFAGVVWRRGALTYNTTSDIYISGAASGSIYSFSGYRSEGSAALLNTVFSGSGAIQIMLENIVFNAATIIANGQFIQCGIGGSLTIKNVSAINSAAVVPVIALTAGGYQGVTIQGLMTSAPITSLCSITNPTKVIGTISSYVQLSSTGSIPAVAATAGPVSLAGT